MVNHPGAPIEYIQLSVLANSIENFGSHLVQKLSCLLYNIIFF